jgi:hypothetical protein
MSYGLPCPNPACEHTFPPAAVKGAASLTCPRCGTVYQLRAGATAPAAPAPVPSPAPPVHVPLAERIDPEPEPPANGPPPEAFPDPPADGGAIVAPTFATRRRGMRGWQVALAALAVLAVLAGLPLAGIMMFRGEKPPPPPASERDPDLLILNGMVRTLRGREEKAFRLVIPRDVWQADRVRKEVFGAPVSLERGDSETEEPSRWVVAAAKDYGTRLPRDSELLKRGISLLELYFGEQLELDERPQTRDLGGRRAQCLRFRGEANAVTWYGEMYTLAGHGFGYWLFVGASGGDDAVRETVEELYAKGRGFEPAAERSGWTEQPPPRVTFAGGKLPYRLTAPAGVWEERRAGDVDPLGDLYLLARPDKGKDDALRNLKNATVLTAVLPRATKDLRAAMKEARKYVEGRWKEENADYELVPAGDPAASPDGEVRNLGDQLTRVAELKLVRQDETVKYVLLAAVHRPDAVLVFRCDAHWGYHQVWRGDILDLLDTLRLNE